MKSANFKFSICNFHFSISRLSAAPGRAILHLSGARRFRWIHGAVDSRRGADGRGWTPSTWAKAGRHAQPELGWALIRAYWGHGYATEAAAAIRDWAREALSIDGLVSLISPDNIRSQRVAERLGAIPTEAVTPLDTRRKAVVWRHRPAHYCGLARLLGKDAPTDA